MQGRRAEKPFPLTCSCSPTICSKDWRWQKKKKAVFFSVNKNIKTTYISWQEQVKWWSWCIVRMFQLLRLICTLISNNKPTCSISWKFCILFQLSLQQIVISFLQLRVPRCKTSCSSRVFHFFFFFIYLKKKIGRSFMSIHIWRRLNWSTWSLNPFPLQWSTAWGQWKQSQPLQPRFHSLPLSVSCLLTSGWLKSLSAEGISKLRVWDGVPTGVKTLSGVANSHIDLGYC